MNWSAVAAIVGVIGILVTLLSHVRTSGRNDQRLTEGERRMDGHDDRLDTHAGVLSEHDKKLARLQGFADGVNAARVVSAPRTANVSSVDS